MIYGLAQCLCNGLTSFWFETTTPRASLHVRSLSIPTNAPHIATRTKPTVYQVNDHNHKLTYISRAHHALLTQDGLVLEEPVPIL